MMTPQMAEETYNGWTNRETWVVNLWLTNEQGTYNESRAVVAQAVAVGRKYARENGWPIDANTGYGLAAERLSVYVGELVEEEYSKATMLSDLINTALGRVNWLEIAKAMGEE